MEMLQRRITNQSKHGRSTPSHWWIIGGQKNMVASPPHLLLSSLPSTLLSSYPLLSSLLSYPIFSSLLSFTLSGLNRTPQILSQAPSYTRLLGTFSVLACLVIFGLLSNPFLGKQKQKGGGGQAGKGECFFCPILPPSSEPPGRSYFHPCGSEKSCVSGLHDMAKK